MSGNIKDEFRMTSVLRFCSVIGSCDLQSSVVKPKANKLLPINLITN